MASSVTGPELPEAPFPFFDKVVHFGVYTVLSLLFFRAFYAMEKWRPWTCVGLCILLTTAYGGWDEYRQASVEGRHTEGWDLVVDAIGGCMAAVMPALINRKPEWYQWLK